MAHPVLFAKDMGSESGWRQVKGCFNQTETLPLAVAGQDFALPKPFAAPAGVKVHMYPTADAPFRPEAPFVRDQVHIGNAEAAQLARALARQTGKTIVDRL
jgi:hypothetical protein